MYRQHQCKSLEVLIDALEFFSDSVISDIYGE